jgi:hypothetical protein
MTDTIPRKIIPSRDDRTAMLKDATRKLLGYCRANDWAGYDPFDALNSKIYKSLPFMHFRLARLALTQALKRSPLNFRSLLLVPKIQSSKGLALFLSALLKLSRLGLLDQEELIGTLTDKLAACRSPNTAYWCWGYNFDWQNRTGLVPQGTPNIICTVFVANALLDAYESCREPRYLTMAASAAEFLLNVLYWTNNDSVACFSYTPLGRSQVHNANLFGAAFLCRVSQEIGKKAWLEPALRAARFSVSKQHEDGSWDYGESTTQRWIDNFHTGFNLRALRSIGRYAETSEFESHLRRGFDFYRNRFFRENGAPRYYHDRTYPIDIHSVAESIITLVELSDLDPSGVSLAHSVLGWAMANMWNERGYFYYRKLPYCTIKIPYMRWGQAWMLLALTTLLDECNSPGRVEHSGRAPHNARSITQGA